MTEQSSFLEGPGPGEYLIPDGAKPETCRSCGANIVWGTTPKGAAVPLDMGRVKRIGGELYALTHFATCPHGREWRRH